MTSVVAWTVMFCLADWRLIMNVLVVVFVYYFMLVPETDENQYICIVNGLHVKQKGCQGIL